MRLQLPIPRASREEGAQIPVGQAPAPPGNAQKSAQHRERDVTQVREVPAITASIDRSPFRINLIFIVLLKPILDPEA